LTAFLVAPLSVTPSASATVLFTCTGVSADSRLGLSPGWSHTQTAQSANGSIGIGFAPSQCDNGESGVIQIINPVTSYSPRPIGCPVAWGGAGPDYADQTPLLPGDIRSFKTIWYTPPRRHSNGVVKAKAGPAGDQYRLIFSIAAGAYAPPPGQKTKIKFTANIAPAPGWSYTCADDTDALEYVTLTVLGSVIVAQQ